MLVEPIKLFKLKNEAREGLSMLSAYCTKDGRVLPVLMLFVNPLFDKIICENI